MKKKTENLKDLIKEHVHLVRVLETKKGTKAEAKKQSKELKEYRKEAK